MTHFALPGIHGSVKCNFLSICPYAFCAVLVVILCFTGTAYAADAPPVKAEDILDKYVEVTGGKAAYEKIHNRVMKGKFEIPALGVEGSIAIYQAEPAKFYSIVEATVLGKIEEGADGEVAWELSAMRGPRVKQGAERAAVLRGAQFDATVNWRKVFKKVECAGVETIDDKPCYKIVLTPPEGKPETQYYDKESNLLVRTDFILQHTMGDIPIQVYHSDYRKVDGVALAHTVRQVTVGQEHRITIDAAEHNATIPKERFALPAEIEALVSKSKAENKSDKAEKTSD